MSNEIRLIILGTVMRRVLGNTRGAYRSRVIKWLTHIQPAYSGNTVGRRKRGVDIRHHRLLVPHPAKMSRGLIAVNVIVIERNVARLKDETVRLAARRHRRSDMAAVNDVELASIEEHRTGAKDEVRTSVDDRRIEVCGAAAAEHRVLISVHINVTESDSVCLYGERDGLTAKAWDRRILLRIWQFRIRIVPRRLDPERLDRHIVRLYGDCANVVVNRQIRMNLSLIGVGKRRLAESAAYYRQISAANGEHRTTEVARREIKGNRLSRRIRNVVDDVLYHFHRKRCIRTCIEIANNKVRR